MYQCGEWLSGHSLPSLVVAALLHTIGASLARGHQFPMPPIAGAPEISPAGVILPICHSFTLVLPRGRDIRIQIPQ